MNFIGPERALREREKVRDLRVRVYVIRICVRAMRECVFVCVCVSVCEREKERESACQISRERR